MRDETPDEPWQAIEPPDEAALGELIGELEALDDEELRRRLAKARERTCLACGETFVPRSRRRDARYCPRSRCRMRALRARRQLSAS